VVTVNDYLARRDSEWVGQVHRFLGLSVGLVQTGLSEDARKAAYAADVTYVTNSELGFDFLRDNLAQARAPGPGGGPHPARALLGSPPRRTFGSTGPVVGRPGRCHAISCHVISCARVGGTRRPATLTYNPSP
jgi:hypothetical protein